MRRSSVRVRLLAPMQNPRKYVVSEDFFLCISAPPWVEDKVAAKTKHNGCPDQYNCLNAEYLVDHTLFDLKNGREYSIIMARYESGGVTMIRIAIVDDEPVAIETIAVTFKQIQNDLNVTFQIDKFTSGKELLDALHVTAYDALFLDIDMPQDSGFAISAFLRENSNNIPIVYITNRDDLTQQAFQYKVLGFVRKNHLTDELPFAVECVLQEIRKTAKSPVAASAQKEPVPFY